MASEYSLTVVLEKMYENQLGLEAALMELVLLVEQQGYEPVGENAGFNHQGLARLRNLEKD
ncbi:hypothetical protein HK44_001020 [Pseudomonas fluorescens HK44]|uniref:Uncharacterized protein n=1 Tax=Pseudomonas fluorescens HK44 TaxID=1042209 RepID=A0A010SUG6_PSEFL|nr:hypothetical protein [Pseudomonas fluorescens]EXF94568.1 hypothetical protein HK44_001020 [Pseudomonas fluorescens HK44]